jgi:hypothetical protein
MHVHSLIIVRGCSKDMFNPEDIRVALVCRVASVDKSSVAERAGSLLRLMRLMLLVVDVSRFMRW